MAETKTVKKTVAARAAAKPAAKKAVVAKAAPAKPAVKAPAKKAVARPVTRAATPRREARVEAPKREPRAKIESKPLPTAPAGFVPVIAANGDPFGSFELPEMLGAPKKRNGVLFQAFQAERANARLGTAATKNRARVAGGGAKPWAQKGTGRARQGSVGSGTTPGRVWKGLRMAAHQGAARITVKNLEVLRADGDRSILLIAGAVPGARNGIVMVRKA